MTNIIYYTLSVDAGQLSAGLAGMLAYQIHNDELYVSPNLKLSGIFMAAHIDELETAKSFLDVCQDIFHKRYGDEVVLRMDEYSGSPTAKLIRKVASDSKLIRARLDQKCFAPNRKPDNAGIT